MQFGVALTVDPTPLPVEITNDPGPLDWSSGVVLPALSLLVAVVALFVAIRAERRQLSDKRRDERVDYGKQLHAYSMKLRDETPLSPDEGKDLKRAAPDRHGLALLNWLETTYGQLEAEYRPKIAREFVHDAAADKIAVWVETGKPATTTALRLPPPRFTTGG